MHKACAQAGFALRYGYLVRECLPIPLIVVGLMLGQLRRTTAYFQIETAYMIKTMKPGLDRQIAFEFGAVANGGT